MSGNNRYTTDSTELLEHAGKFPVSFEVDPQATKLALNEETELIGNLQDESSLRRMLARVESQVSPEVPSTVPGTLLSRLESARAILLIGLASVPVVAFGTGLRLWDLGQQSAYMDEANYILTGRTFVETGKPYANALEWTYGSLLYPVFSNWLNQLGGLTAVRTGSAIWSAVTILATIFLTVGLFKSFPESHRQARADFALTSRSVMAGLMAGLVVAIMPTAIGIGRFGTYDAMAVALFACGYAAYVWAWRESALAKSAGVKRTGSIVTLLGVAAIFLFLAFLTKYVVAIYLPLLCLVHLFNKHGRKTGLFAFILPLSLACAAYYVAFSSDLNKLLQFSSSYTDLRSNDWFGIYIWERLDILGLLLLTYWGFRQALRDNRRGSSLLLVGSALIMICFQLITRPDFDFWKHSVFLVVLGAPLIGWLWSYWCWWEEPTAETPRGGKVAHWWNNLKTRREARGSSLHTMLKIEEAVAGDAATERPNSYSLLAVLAVILVVASIFWGYPNGSKLVSHWPSVTPAVPAIAQASKNARTALVDDSALVYYLADNMPAKNVTTPYYNDYKGLSGLDAFKAAVRDLQYDVIVFDGGVTPAGKSLWKDLRPVVLASSDYKKVFSLPLDSTNLDAPHTLEIYLPTTRAESFVAPVVATAPAAKAQPKATATASATTAPVATTKAPATAVTPAVSAATPEATTASAKPTTVVIKEATYPANASYNFDNGDEGWGALPTKGELEPGVAVTSSEDYKLGGHKSLKFTPQPLNKLYTVGVNRTGTASKVTLGVFIPADKADGEVRVGLYAFDDKWGWHDDGFKTTIVPGKWNELTFEIPGGSQPIKQVGLKLVGYSGSIYINGVNVAP
ncbi:MAG TPA: hypothetical protein VH186_18035 [Chloroflexia bacterium]|nr:hypothetical protein [Chloroflexia bacterium]